MIVQMSLVSLGVKVVVASVPGAEEVVVWSTVVWSMVAMISFCGCCVETFLLAVVPL